MNPIISGQKTDFWNILCIERRVTLHIVGTAGDFSFVNLRKRYLSATVTNGMNICNKLQLPLFQMGAVLCNIYGADL